MRSRTFRAPNILNIIFLGFVLWFTTDLVSLVFRSGGPPPVVSYIGYLAFVLCALFVRIAQGRSAINIVSWRQSRNIWLWLFLVLGWNQINFLYSSQSQVALQSLINHVEMIHIFIASLWFFLAQDLRKNVGHVMAIVAIFGSIVNINDFFHPLFSAVPGRAAGLYENPNTSGLILILSLSSGILAVPMSLRRPLVILVSLGVFLTFSRGSWLVLGVSLLLFAWQGYLGAKAMRFLLTGLGGIISALFLITMLSGSLEEFVGASPVGNYLDANTMARLGGSEFGSDDSADQRRAVAQLAIAYFLDGHSQIFGYGLGYTSEWKMDISTHNMYLLFLVEGGLFGLAFYLSLLGVIWRSASGIGRLVVFQFAAFSFFDHNLLDTPGRIIFLAMAGAGVLGSRR